MGLAAIQQHQNTIKITEYLKDRHKIKCFRGCERIFALVCSPVSHPNIPYTLSGTQQENIKSPCHVLDSSRASPTKCQYYGDYDLRLTGDVQLLQCVP